MRHFLRSMHCGPHGPGSAATECLCWLLAAVVAVAMALCTDTAAAQAPNTAPEPTAALQVDSRASIKLWPSLSLLADTNATHRAEDLVSQPQRFYAPAGTPSNLGRQYDTVWLRVPLHVTGTAAVQRVLEMDYPSLNRIDLSLWRDGLRVASHRLGNQLALADRPLATRTHAATLDLHPGNYVLLLRVQSLSSLVLPITLRTPADFTRQESQEQLAQGVLLGVALCMLLYSLAHWLSLRDPVFLDYALLIAGNTIFGLSYFGIGALWVWPNAPELSARLGPMGVMVAVVAGTRFTRATLVVREISPLLDAVLRAVGVVTLLGLVALCQRHGGLPLCAGAGDGAGHRGHSHSATHQHAARAPGRRRGALHAAGLGGVLGRRHHHCGAAARTGGTHVLDPAHLPAFHAG